MLSNSIRRLWQAEEPSPDPSVETPFWEDADHDLIARYAIVGIFVILAVGALHHAQPIAMPLVAGSLLGVVLGPLADRLVRIGVPQAVAATAIVLAVILVTLLILASIATPVVLWIDQLPELVRLIQRKFAGVLAYAKQIEGLGGSMQPGSARTVEVANGGLLSGLASGSSAAATGLLLFFATLFAYLATRRHLKARVLRLCLGRAARQSAGMFFEEIERRMAAYFGVLTLVNIGVGLVTTAIAWSFGVPLAIVWGAAAFVMNYVPIIGPVIITALLFGAGLADDGSALSAAVPAAVYYAAHVVESNLVTPLAVGRRLTVSPFMVLVSFVFWLWLWGPVGAVLSTPILLLATLALEVISGYRAAMASETADASTAGSPTPADHAPVSAMQASAA